MLNDISRHKFYDMSQLVWLEGKHTAQRAHCAVGCTMDIQEKASNDQSLEFSLSFASFLYFGQRFTGILVGAGIW